MNRVKARRDIAILIVSFFVGTLVLCGVLQHVRGWHVDRATAAFELLLGIYAPIFAIAGGFFLGERVANAVRAETTPPDAYYAAIVCIALWLSVPPTAVLMIDYIENAISTIVRLQGWGQAVSGMGLTYYYARKT